jgi:hypothetical protein
MAQNKDIQGLVGILTPHDLKGITTQNVPGTANKNSAFCMPN